MRPWPAWLVFLLFVPLQVYFAILLFREWSWWAALLFLLVLGILGNRASRAPLLMALFAPGWAMKRERRRHVFQGILLLGSALVLLLHYADVASYGPVFDWLRIRGGVPLLAAMGLTTLVKASVR